MRGRKVKTGLSDQKTDLTFRIAFVGILAVLIAFLIAVIAFHGAQRPGEVIPAVLGVVTAAIGTLAGLVAGHAAGSAGKAEAETRASSNEHDAAAGRALAQVMLAGKPKGSPATAEEHALQGPSEPIADDVAERHADLAQRLFPDL